MAVIISESRKFCFIHIPRTGGTTINKLLSKEVDDLKEITNNTYSTIGDAYKLSPELISDDYYKFSYVRNPYDLLVSLFSSINFNINHPDYKIIRKLSFPEFIEWLNDVGMKREDDGNTPIYRKQSDYLFINNKLSVDYVYRYEEICDDMSTSNINSLFLKLGYDMPNNIPVLNKSERSFDWSYLYNDRAYRLVNRLFLDDFVNFKYHRKDVR